MRWPWQRRRSGGLLALSWDGQSLAYVQAQEAPEGRFEVRRFGVEAQGQSSTADFARHLEGLGLKGASAHVMLRPRQYQWLQIDAPGVAPEELRSAARYQIREMLDTHVDDVTLDVMRVGDGQHKGAAHLFVIAAPNAALRSVTDLGNSMRWKLPVIDVQETAQRNLQNVLAHTSGHAERANAALVLVDDTQAVLTICANDEIFYTRRLDVPPGFLAERWGNAGVPNAEVVDAFMPVEEYVPGHAGLGEGLDGPLGQPVATRAQPADATEGAQRFLLEVQRSLDLWDRAWSNMPLAAVRVYAGSRSAELASWLTRELGQSVMAMDVDAWFPGFADAAEAVRAQCWPLLGLLLRTETRQL